MKKNILLLLFLIPAIVGAADFSFDKVRDEYYVNGAHGDCESIFYGSKEKLQSLIAMGIVKNCPTDQEEMVDIRFMPFPGTSELEYSLYDTSQQQTQQETFDIMRIPDIGPGVKYAGFWIETLKPKFDWDKRKVLLSFAIHGNNNDLFLPKISCNFSSGDVTYELPISGEGSLLTWSFDFSKHNFSKGPFMCYMTATNLTKPASERSAIFSLYTLPVPKINEIVNIEKDSVEINLSAWAYSKDEYNLSVSANEKSTGKRIVGKTIIKSRSNSYQDTIIIKDLEPGIEQCVKLTVCNTDNSLCRSSLYHCFETPDPDAPWSQCTNAIRESSKFNMDRATRIAEKISETIAIRKEFLLGIAAKETQLGRFMGTHTINTCKNSMRSDKSDFLYICDTLKIPAAECKAMKCSYSCAFGVAQFIPSTWRGYLSKTSVNAQEIFNVNEQVSKSWWNICTALTGSATKLSTDGAYHKTAEWEKKVACAYNTGQFITTCPYAQEVLDRAKCFEQYYATKGIVSKACKDLIYGWEGE